LAQRLRSADRCSVSRFRLIARRPRFLAGACPRWLRSGHDRQLALPPPELPLRPAAGRRARARRERAQRPAKQQEGAPLKRSSRSRQNPPVDRSPTHSDKTTRWAEADEPSRRLALTNPARPFGAGARCELRDVLPSRAPTRTRVSPAGVGGAASTRRSAP
jgi:hypothetical protein